MGWPRKYNLSIYQGDTFEKTITLAKNGVPWPTGTLTWKAQVRNRSGAAVVAEITVTCVTDELKHTLHLSIDAETMASIESQTGKWDLEVSRASDGWKKTLLAGQATITAEITR